MDTTKSHAAFAAALDRLDSDIEAMNRRIDQREFDRTQDWLQRMEYNEMRREMRGRCDTGTYSCDCSCGDSKMLHSAMVAAAWHADHARDGHRPKVTWMGWKSH